MKKLINKLIVEVLNHESIKAADAAITLQALRSSTKGYEGESLKVVLEKVLKIAYKEGQKNEKTKT